MGLQFLFQNGRQSFTPMKDKCDAIHNLEPPKTICDCRTLCGMVNFLATFLQDLEKLLVPIYNLTRKDFPFVWTEECQHAFEAIKSKLSNSPIYSLYGRHSRTFLPHE